MKMKKKFLSISLVIFTSLLANAQDVTSYRGAFAPAPVKMWTDDWVNWDPKNTVYPVTDSTITNNVAGNITLSPSHVYLISGLVHIPDGATLTILPGTILRGNYNPGGSASGIVVQRGAKLIAEGSPCHPIVFTSNRTVAEGRAAGDWAGIILLGKSPNNQGLNINIEGISQTDPNAQYGGNIENDNSGTLKYVRIEFPGFVFSVGNEINGLTFGSVGSGTTVDYVQVSYSNDDSYEWFGGSVVCKHLVAYRGLDDDFDTDFGYHGLVQYGLAIKDPTIADDPAASTSEGFESDNEASGTTETFYPKTSAAFYNITQIGAFRCASNADGSGVVNGVTVNGFRRGARLRRNTDLKIVNSIFMNNRRGLFIDGALALANVDQDSLVFRNNIIAADFTTSFVSTSGNGVCLIAEDDNTRSKINTIAYANDSVNTCSLLTNAWDFLNPDYRPNSAGAGSVVVTNLNSGTNLAATSITGNPLFTAGQTRTMTPNIVEGGGGTTSGIITVSIPKLSGWTLGVPGIVVSGTPQLGVNGGIGTGAYTNANWFFSDNGTNIIATSRPGLVIPKGGSVRLGITATRNAGTATGTNQNLNATISGGGDTTPFNNVAVVTLSAN